MAQPLLYIAQPQVQDLPPDQNPAALAWFGQWASGHLSHVGQAVVNWAKSNGVPLVPTAMSWGEYQRLLAESHWYER